MQSKQVKLLEKIGTLKVIPGTDFSTTKQVADFFEVKVETINSAIIKNLKMLSGNDFEILKTKDVIEQSNQISSWEKKRANCFVTFKNKEKVSIGGKGIRIFKTKTVLKLAFLLTSSEKAKQLKQEVFDYDKELYSELSHTTTLRSKRKEEFCFENIRLNFPQVKIERQKKIKNYSVDFCLNDSIYLEIDELGHSGYDDKKEKQRTETIEAEIGKKLVRFNPDKQEPFELILTIAEVLKCNR